MRENIYKYTNQIVEAMGYFPVSATNELLAQMQLFNFAILFIGLVFNILIILFVVISILLIYSLLMITTETKTFDIGVMRLVGLSSKGFVAMIFTQGVIFVIPSIIAAYISSFPSLYLIFKSLFSKELLESMGFIAPTALATFEAVSIGLLIPTLSAIIPIQRALAKSLSDSLNTARTTLSGTIVIVEDKNIRVLPYIIFGLVCVTIGTSIYIILPQALLAENASLILEIFFAILVGMILGMTLFTANLRGIFETFLIYALFFWERKSMRALLKKNLIAHKATNKLTSVIYALTLGCVIFLCVSLNLVLNSVNASSGMPGADIYLTYMNDRNSYTPQLNVTSVDPILRSYSSSIKDFGFIARNDTLVRR